MGGQCDFFCIFLFRVIWFDLESEFSLTAEQIHLTRRANWVYLESKFIWPRDQIHLTQRANSIDLEINSVWPPNFVVSWRSPLLLRAKVQLTYPACNTASKFIQQLWIKFHLYFNKVINKSLFPFHFKKVFAFCLHTPFFASKVALAVQSVLSRAYWMFH